MPVIDIKGLRIGEGIPKTIVSLMAEGPLELASEVRRLADSAAECIEWRADAYRQTSNPDGLAGACLSLVDALGSKPLIFTYRTKDQGGLAAPTKNQYLRILEAVIVNGQPDAVDVELGVGADPIRRLVRLAHDHGVYAIVSHHDFAGTPSHDAMLHVLLSEAKLGADICKLAVMAQDDEDCERLMYATACAHEQLGTPLITMAMGEHGKRSRLEGETFGSAMTFCALGTSSAPGQVDLAEARKTMAALHVTFDA